VAPAVIPVTARLKVTFPEALNVCKVSSKEPELAGLLRMLRKIFWNKEGRRL
jgi:hypothetical protein